MYEVKENADGYRLEYHYDRAYAKGHSVREIIERIRECEVWMYCEESKNGIVEIHGHAFIKGNGSLEVAQWFVTNELGNLQNATNSADSDMPDEYIRYMEKEDCFYRSWEEPLDRFRDLKLLPWQEAVHMRMVEQNDRKILVIKDGKGCTGKTWLANFWRSHGAGGKLTIVSDLGQMRNDAYNVVKTLLKNERNKRVFLLVDVPRAGKIAPEVYSLLEEVKNGYLVDTRYTHRELNFVPPAICVFTNSKDIDLKHLSRDRWDIMTLEDGKLTEVNVNVEI